MLKPKIPLNEEDRIKALESFEILNTLEEEEYDAITRIAAEICNTPMALVSLVDSDRQWFKSHYGIDATETPRDLAFCAHAINNPEELFIVKDSSKDERFADNPLVTGGPQVQFYAGAPLNTKDGFSIGTLCVIDTLPRTNFTPKQQACLRSLANQVMAQLELRRQNSLQQIINNELSVKNNQLKHFTYRLAHDMKTPLQGIGALVSFIKMDYLHLLKDTDVPEWLDTIEDRVSYMEALINGIMNYTNIMNSEVEYNEFHIATELHHISQELGKTSHISLTPIGCDRTIVHSLKSFNQIFSELILNSIKFSRQELTEIKISFAEGENSYSFTYEDNGPGIPEKYWEKVFVMFETLRKENPTDTGIGLATIRAIIEKLGGRIELKNHPDKRSGIYFQISLLKETGIKQKKLQK
ncbi:sensor histidine kinase [Zobellia russellii]|uniref:sensor histidine kinase n=1 Tax=Zobellia russellii TaxID=248907 RepID=UPI001BFF9E37|nr:ATP-binding protein [Zobellia russellii]MBT9187115.1 GAF domain-containing protein [Zobellia russellii]